MSNETPFLSKYWRSPDLLLSAAKSADESMNVPRSSAPRNEEWCSPSLFLAAANLSIMRPSFPLAELTVSQSVNRSILTPWESRREQSNFPYSGGVQGVSRLPPLTPYLHPNSRSNTILFSPMDSGTQNEDSGVFIRPGLRTTNEGVHGAEEKNHTDGDEGHFPRRTNTTETLSVETFQTKNERNDNHESSVARATHEGKMQIVDSWNHNDVILGSGPKSPKANEEFRRLLALHKQEFHNTSKTKKTFIVKKVILEVKRVGGKFLKKVSGSNRYRVLEHDKEIHRKVSEALRLASKNLSVPLTNLSHQPPPNKKAAPNLTKSIKPTDTTQTTTRLAATINGTPVVAEIVSPSKTKENVGNLPSIVKKTKRSSAGIIDDANSKRTKNITTTQTTSKPNLLEQMDGVRVSITKKGSFEARYKPTGLGLAKSVFPKYIACVHDRDTAVAMGNFVAKFLKDNPEMTFSAAKERAVNQFKVEKQDSRHLGQGCEKKSNSQEGNLPQALVDEVVDQLANEDDA